MKRKRKKITYIYDEEFKTIDGEKTTEKLIKIFNEKYYKTIMKIETNNFEDYDVK